jgi:CHASE2 domain-containing sensor protein
MPRKYPVVLFRFIGSRARGWNKSFYLILAAAIIGLAALDLFIARQFTSLDEGVYDTLIKYRISGPAAATDIVIVDIDERSLELVGKDHGRWPWSRSVIAEVIASIADQEPAVAIVNILFSDPNISDVDGDNVLNMIGDNYESLVFPFVRLPEINDENSKLSATLIPGARQVPVIAQKANASNKVAVVLPFMTGLQRNIGVSNLESDADGIIRSYRYWYSAGNYLLPSLAATGSSMYGSKLSEDNGKRLNWRNKSSNYKRISFSDLYLATQGKSHFDWSVFRGRIVILGPTAPGISVIKPTSASPVTDDNIILATAIDDAINDTGLRKLRAEVLFAIAAFLVIFLCWSFLSGVSQNIIDMYFFVGQFLLILITLISISYTNIVLDMTLPFNAGMSYFIAARSFFIAKKYSEQGKEYFWNSGCAESANIVMPILITSASNKESRLAITLLKKHIVNLTGNNNYLNIDQLTEVETFLGRIAYDTHVIVLFTSKEIAHKLEAEIKIISESVKILYRIKKVAGVDIEGTRLVVWREVTDMFVTLHQEKINHGQN